jgi:ribonuclease HI
MTVYIAGSVHAPPRTKPSAATGLFIEAEDIRNRGRSIPKPETQSQYVAELYATLEAIRNTSSDTTLTIISTQNSVQEAMNKKLAVWEHEGWVGVPHHNILRCLAAELKARKAPTFFKLAVPGSSGRMLCRQAAVLAKRAARTQTQEAWDLTLPQGTALPGLSLQDNCQRVFYRSIREIKTQTVAPRKSTIANLGKIREAIKDVFDRFVSDAEIWKAVSAKDILPRTAQFLWRGTHNALRIGKYWTHIPECGDRAKCKDCDVIEDLDHILTGCKSPGQEIIWRAAKTLWLEKEATWPDVSLGTILGCGLAEFCNDKGRAKLGTQRLYRILMSESAYQIWLIRNNCVISRDGAPASEDEVVNKCKSSINQRLQVDKMLATRPSQGKHPALPLKVVLETWASTLDNESSLPADWLREPRVLVGSHAFPQTQTRCQLCHRIG